MCEIMFRGGFFFRDICIHKYRYMCTCIHQYRCMCSYIYIYTYIEVGVGSVRQCSVEDLFLELYVYINIDTCVHVYIYIGTCVRIYTYIYIYRSWGWECAAMFRGGFLFGDICIHKYRYMCTCIH